MVNKVAADEATHWFRNEQPHRQVRLNHQARRAMGKDLLGLLRQVCHVSISETAGQLDAIFVIQWDAEYRIYETFTAIWTVRDTRDKAISLALQWLSILKTWNRRS